MRNIKIYGGCVSRDVFNFVTTNDMHLISYNARSSSATLGLNNCYKSIKKNYYDLLLNIESSFQRRMVESDFNNDILTVVASKDYDLLLIDLLVERFHLAELDGKLVTNSSEFQRSKIKPDRLIDTFSSEYMELWCKGIDNLFNIVDKTVGLNAIRINKVYWADFSINSAYTLELNKKWEIGKNNEKLNNMYNYIEKILPATSIVEISKNFLIANPNHRFGFSPFHYIDEYYEELLKRLN